MAGCAVLGGDKEVLKLLESLLEARRDGEVLTGPSDLVLFEAGLLEAVNGRVCQHCMARLTPDGGRLVDAFLAAVGRVVRFSGDGGEVEGGCVSNSNSVSDCAL